MATENEYVDNLFREIEIFQKIEMPNENKNNNQKLLVALFQEIETELSELLFLQNEGSESDDETDGPIQFIKNIVEKVKKDFDGVVVDEEKKTFLSVLTKIFATLLSVKADNIEKIIDLIEKSLLTMVKSWSEQN